MAQKVTAMDLRAATAMAGQIPNVAAFCREQGISRETFYKWRRRFEAGGIDGLAEKSRRPTSAPGQTPAAVEEVVLRRRKELADGGADCGPQSIQWTFQRGTELTAEQIPSRTTIWRILKRYGMIVEQPRKRPKSSLRRFVYARPNECWQSDWTSWHLPDGTKVAIAGTLDDHSRYLPGLQAHVGDGTAELTWATMTSAIGECGIPAMSLTDNGYVYTGRRHNFVAAFEANLRALGVKTINSSPYHPQTCGKIERFWQTLKRFLDARNIRRRPSRNSTSCSMSFATTTTTNGRTAAFGVAPPPRPSLLLRKPGRQHDRYPHRFNISARTSTRPAECLHHHSTSTSAGNGADTASTSSATATTSRSSAETASSVNSPPTPAGPTNPQPTLTGPENPPNPSAGSHTRSVSDDPRQKCQRRRETSHPGRREKCHRIRSDRPSRSQLRR